MDIFRPHLDRIRDIDIFRERIAHTEDRILVEGTRGKSSTVRLFEELIRETGRSTLAKTTGETPELIYNGTTIPIFREKDAILLDYDNIPSVVNFEVDALIYENQAITPYTMRYIHHIFRPNHVVIPNIRIDHVEGLGKDLPEMTTNFTKNMFATEFTKEVYYTEPIGKVHDLVAPILREFAEENPHLMVLHDVPIAEDIRSLPGIENIAIAAYFMEHHYGKRVDVPLHLRRIKKKLKIRENREGVKFFNASKINDPISFVHMITYLLHHTSDNIALVGYLRKDRAGRNEIFEDFFAEIHEKFSDRIEMIWLAGYSTEQMFRMMPDGLRQITRFPVDTADIDAILRHTLDHGLILVPIINRVNDFMDALMERLEDRWDPASRERFAYDPVAGLVRESPGTEPRDSPE